MSLSINSRYLDDYLKETWASSIQENSENGDGQKKKNATDSILVSTPFRCFALPEFVDFSKCDFIVNDNGDNNGSSSCVPKCPKSYLDSLLEELGSLDMNEIKNDLYNFRQSADLANANSPAIEAFKIFFKTKVKSWIQQLTAIQLDDHVSMTASAYGYCNYLLCHDDELERRRIAYTFYLTPNWTESDGGHLDLFSSDEQLQPLDVAKSIVPAQNMLAFFEVVPQSFHQVSEVKSKDKVRWSINGWFYGAEIDRPKLAYDEAPKKLRPCSVEFDDLLAWINPDYFDEDTQANIRKHFEETSEIELQHFLQAERYDAVMEELSGQLNWTHRRQWNRRHYSSLDDGNQIDEKLFPNLAFCVRLMHSDAMYLLLSQFTNVTIHPFFKEIIESSNSEAGASADVDYCPPTKKRAENGDSGVSSAAASTEEVSDLAEPMPCELELRRFEPGCYTVLRDSDFASAKDQCESVALDVQLFFTKHDWDVNHGGCTYYFEKDSTEELVVVAPCGNSLALVCREPGVSKFVKYINRSAVDDLGGCPSIVDISATFYEVGREDSNDIVASS